MKFPIALISLMFLLNACKTETKSKEFSDNSQIQIDNSEVRFNDDFEGDYTPHPSNQVYDQWYRSGWYGDGYVKVASDVKARKGSKYVEAKMVANTDGRSRSEIGVNLKNSLGEYWCGFSLYIPNDYDVAKMVLDENLFVSVLAQWGVWQDNPGLPDFALRMGGKDGKPMFFLTYEPSITLDYLWEAPLIQGEWVDWVVHINWAKDDTGVFEVWQNGKMVFSKYNFQSTDGVGSDVKSKIGLYFSNWASKPRGYDEMKVYFDEYAIAKGKDMYDAVAPK